MVQIEVNGQGHSATADCSVADLIEQFSLLIDRILVEYNGEVLSRDAFASTALKTGDKLELIEFVAGG